MQLQLPRDNAAQAACDPQHTHHTAHHASSPHPPQAPQACPAAHTHAATGHSAPHATVPQHGAHGPCAPLQSATARPGDHSADTLCHPAVPVHTSACWAHHPSGRRSSTLSQQPQRPHLTAFGPRLLACLPNVIYMRFSFCRRLLLLAREAAAAPAAKHSVLLALHLQVAMSIDRSLLRTQFDNR